MLDEINAFCEYTLDHRGPTVNMNLHELFSFDLCYINLSFLT